MQTKDTRRQPAKKSQTASRTKAGATGVASGRRPASKTASKPAAKPAAKRRPTPAKPTPDVVYTQPGPFNKPRFVLCLLIVVAVVLALIFGMSLFFKVDEDKILVSGTDKYTAWQIREASGIQAGENLMSISEPRISNNITSALPYVNKVRVGIKLPDTVKIEIEELAVVYAVESTDGSWWLMRSDGGIVEKTNSADAQQHTKILGIQIVDPAQGQQAQAAKPVQPEATVPDTQETTPVTVLPSEQLATAISIAQFLEDSGIIGEAASIDVSNLGDLQLWYGQRYQVILGDTLELSYKIRTMKSAIDQMGDYQSGILDVSFTTWPNEVGYTPFS